MLRHGKAQQTAAPWAVPTIENHRNLGSFFEWAHAEYGELEQGFSGNPKKEGGMGIRWRRWLLIPMGILAFSVIHPFGWSQQGAASKPLVLRGATLIDGAGRPPISDAVIVIEGDKVKAVGGKQTHYPSDSTLLDLSGKFVIPGFVDSHTHYQRWIGELLLNYGVTTTLALSARDTYGEDYYRASQRPDVRTPRIYDSGASLPLAPSMTRRQIHEMVQEWLKKEPDFAKLPAYNDRVRQVYQWTTEEIHEAGLLTIGHAEDCRGAAGAGLDVVEHLWGCAASLMTPAELENYHKGEYLHWGLFLKDKARIDQLIQGAIQRGGNYLNPTLLYEFSSQTRLALQFEADTYNLYRDSALRTYYPQNLSDGLLAKFRIARSYSTQYGTMVLLAHLSDKELQQSQEAYRLSGEFVKRWAELGGKIAGGSDTPSIGTSGLGLHMEMAMLVESGLTPMQALQAGTLWGAEMLTARRKQPAKPMVGLVAEGGYADLVILSANPLEDIGNTRKIERVMKGGRFVELGYTPYYASTPPGIVRPTPYIQEPEISAILPNRVTEGSPEFEMVVDGEGFLPDSVVRVDGVAVPTTFVDIRTLRAKIPARVVAQAIPDRFVLSTNPEQRVGVYGDRTVKITVFTGPPDGGLSNSVSLKVMAKWLSNEKK